MSKSSSSSTGSAGALTLVVDLGAGMDTISYSVLGYTSGSTPAAGGRGGGGAAKAVQRICTTPRSNVLHPQDFHNDINNISCASTTSAVLQSSPSSVWGPLRDVLSIDRPKQATTPQVDVGTPTTAGGASSHLTRMSVRSMIGAILGDSLVQDEAHALHVVKMNNAAAAAAAASKAGGAEEEGAADQSQVSLSSSVGSTTTREAVEALAARFKLLPLTATEVAVSEEPTIRSHINARIAKVSSDTSNVEFAGLASLAVLAPPQLSSLSTTSSTKHPFFDVSVLVLLPNDPTTTPRIMRESILAAILSLDGVLLGSPSSSSSSSSSSSQIADLISRRFFKLPMRVSKVQFANSAVASLNACGLHSGVVCHIDVGSGQSPSSVSLCAVSNAQPVLPLCRTVPLLSSTIKDSTNDMKDTEDAIRRIAKDFALQLQREISLDVPAVHCSKLPTSTGASTPVVHPLAHSQNTTGVDASSLKDVAKHFIVKISGGAVNAAMGQEFANAFTTAGRGDSIVATAHKLGSKRQRDEDDTTAPMIKEGMSSYFIPPSPSIAPQGGGWHPKEIIATTVPTLIEMVGVDSTITTTATTTSQQEGRHPPSAVAISNRPVIAPSAIQPVDRLSISGIIGGTVLVQLPAFETYFTVTAPQYKVEGPAVSIARVPLDSR